MPAVRITSLAGKEIRLPHPGDEGAGNPFVVEADGNVLVSVPDGEGGRESQPLSDVQASALLEHYRLAGAVSGEEE